MMVDYERVGEVYESKDNFALDGRGAPMLTKLREEAKEEQDESLNDQILEMIVSRMNVGAKKYGEHIMLSDKRNFVEEALEEALDMAVYLCVSLLRLRKNNRGN